jgi:hypothetical protein
MRTGFCKQSRPGSRFQAQTPVFVQTSVYSIPSLLVSLFTVLETTVPWVVHQEHCGLQVFSIHAERLNGVSALLALMAAPLWTVERALPVRARPVHKLMPNCPTLGKLGNESIINTSWNHHHLSRTQPPILDPAFLPKGFNLTWQSRQSSPQLYPEIKRDWWQGRTLLEGSITIASSSLKI